MEVRYQLRHSPAAQVTCLGNLEIVSNAVSGCEIGPRQPGPRPDVTVSGRGISGQSRHSRSRA
jgi:hypothetical protein